MNFCLMAHASTPDASVSRKTDSAGLYGKFEKQSAFAFPIDNAHCVIAKRRPGDETVRRVVPCDELHPTETKENQKVNYKINITPGNNEQDLLFIHKVD